MYMYLKRCGISNPSKSGLLILGLQVIHCHTKSSNLCCGLELESPMAQVHPGCFLIMSDVCRLT